MEFGLNSRFNGFDEYVKLARQYHFSCIVFGYEVEH